MSGILPKGKPVPNVVVHEPLRAMYAPSVSPFPIKLETFLRMAHIPYKSDFKKPFSSKKKTPWMTCDGVDVADSQFCIEYLKKNYGINLDIHLTPKEKAVAHSFRTMLEDHLFWCAMYMRVVRDKFRIMYERFKTPMLMRYIVIPKVARNFKTALYWQGTGRHTLEEIQYMLLEDIKALSTFLGDKKYLMGDRPSEVDCSVFGFMCQFMYNPARGSNVLDEFSNLREYTLRMKEEFWPDWGQCVYPKQQQSKL